MPGPPSHGAAGVSASRVPRGPSTPGYAAAAVWPAVAGRRCDRRGGPEDRSRVATSAAIAVRAAVRRKCGICVRPDGERSSVAVPRFPDQGAARADVHAAASSRRSGGTTGPRWTRPRATADQRVRSRHARRARVLAIARSGSSAPSSATTAGSGFTSAARSTTRTCTHRWWRRSNGWPSTSPPSAPDFVAAPKVSMFRPWRDTRFSADKRPLKTHVAAVFPQRALGRHARRRPLLRDRGPGYVWIGGGLYAPDPPSLHAVRTHIAGHYRRLTRHPGRAGVHRRARRDARRAGRAHAARVRPRPSGGELAAPQAVPRLARGAGVVCHAARLLPAARGHLRGDGPLVRFLNEPLLALQRSAAADPLLADRSGGRFERAPK